MQPCGIHIKLPWGAEHERQRAERLAAGFSHVEVLPKLTLAQVAAQLAGANAVVSVDTGLSHLTAALDRPNITIFGPTDPGLIGGYGKNQHQIGDFINATPLLAYLQKSDVLVSRSVGALAKHDETIEQIYFIEQHKRNLWRKLCFACRIMNRYDNVYLLQPNSVNLFFAAVCNAKNKQFLTIYTRRWYHGIFYLAADGTVEHGKKTLSVTNYLKLADRVLTWQDSPKHATKPLFEPTTWPAILDKPDVVDGRYHPPLR